MDICTKVGWAGPIGRVYLMYAIGHSCGTDIHLYIHDIPMWHRHTTMDKTDTNVVPIYTYLPLTYPCDGGVQPCIGHNHIVQIYFQSHLTDPMTHTFNTHVTPPELYHPYNMIISIIVWPIFMSDNLSWSPSALIPRWVQTSMDRY